LEVMICRLIRAMQDPALPHGHVRTICLRDSSRQVLYVVNRLLQSRPAGAARAMPGRASQARLLSQHFHWVGRHRCQIPGPDGPPVPAVQTTDRWLLRARSLACPLRDLSHQLGDDFEQVAHDAVVGNLEDRRLRVFADRDDRLGGPHARPVLDCTEMPTAMYSCGETVFPVCPTWNWCGYQPASVTARDAPTPAPSASARSSMILKSSALPVPRPPDTTIGASVRSGRPPFSALTRSVTFADFATSLSETLTGMSSAAPEGGSATTEFGRTAMIGVPLRTRECTVMAPPK
jgi:hypothetical protein